MMMELDAVDVGCPKGSSSRSMHGDDDYEYETWLRTLIEKVVIRNQSRNQSAWDILESQFSKQQVEDEVNYGNNPFHGKNANVAGEMANSQEGIQREEDLQDYCLSSKVKNQRCQAMDKKSFPNIVA